jgi:hypothetical protein
MPTIVVRYRTKPERAEENRQLVKNVFAALDEIGATGFAYASFQLEDGETQTPCLGGAGAASADRAEPDTS